MALVNKAKELGYSVQLKHDRTLGTWEEHGWVKIHWEGQVLASSDKIQHNFNWRGMRPAMENLAKAAITKHKELLQASTKTVDDADKTDGTDEDEEADVQTTQTRTTTSTADTDDVKEPELQEQE